MATNDKYDRQLRLWGAAGQRALGETCVILVRATAAGTETCKNLVLPGIGAILVLDDETSIGTQYSSNFFLTKDTSKVRAQMAFESLQELNPDVRGSWNHVPDLMTCDLDDAFTKAKETTTSITKLLVVASDVEPPLLMKLSTLCEQRQIPLVAVHSYGLIGVVRLQIMPPFPLLNPKPRDVPPDLRLVTPFATLQAMAESIQWETLENHEHGHVPFPLILYRMSQQWRSAHDGQLPRTPAEKQAFQATIQAAARNYHQELNFQEAFRNAYTAYSTRELDVTHLASLQTTPELQSLLTALDAFLKAHDQQPPLHGSIPDMTASTEHYVKLQNLYNEKAQQDLAEMKALLPHPVPGETLALFCQNVYSFDVITTSSIAQEYSTTAVVDDELCQDLSMSTMEGDERPDQLPLLWYLGFRGCQAFYQAHGRYPGTTNDDKYLDDVAPLQACIAQVVHTYKLHDNETVQSTLLKATDYATELARYGNAEIHTIASVMGGVASQEAVKLITSQYVPFNNTYVYNGIASTGAVYKF